VLSVTLLLISLDTTILNVALPSIVRSLGADASQLQWIVDAYAVIFAGLLLSAGALGDRVGRKWIFLAGLVVFAGGSAFAAESGSPDRLMLARAVMGMGAAGLMPCTLSILTNVFTEEKDRVRAIGIWSGTTGLGVALGPILGGFLLAHFWWGSVFLVNVPVALVGLVAAVWLVPNSRNPTPGRPDPVGTVLSISGLGLLLWGMIEAPGRGWTSADIMVALLAAGVLIASFVIWELHVDHPMLPLRFFTNRRYSAAIAALALVLFSLVGMFFLMTQYLQFALRYSPLEAGLRIAPVAAVLLVVAPLSMALTQRIGSKAVVSSGMILIALGLGLLSTTTVHGTYRNCVIPFILLGIGVALALAPCIESVMGSLPIEEAGVGSATNDVSMQVGAALGVGVLGTALNLRYQHLMVPLASSSHVPANVQKVIEGSLGGALEVAQRAPTKLGDLLAAAARQAFISGMDLALTIAAIAVGVAAVLVLVLLPNRGTGPTNLGALPADSMKPVNVKR
jgi:EmrB/QacA subfamily drug resistance transporter